MQGPVSRSRSAHEAKSFWKVGGSLLLALAVAVLACGPPAWAQEKAEKPAGPSLYKRVGGYDEIASMVDDWLGYLRKDPAFARFGTGRALDSKVRARQLIVDQLCALSGGPCVYIGREMKTAHQGLEITQQEWETSGKYFAQAMAKHKIPEKEQKELAALVEDLRKDVIEQKK